MRITHIVTKGDFGGAQSIVRELIASQIRSGHLVTLITGTTGKIFNEVTSLGADALRVPELIHAFSPRQDRIAYRAIVSLIEMQKPDILHCHSSKAGHIGRIAARNTKTPSVYTAHGWPFQHGARWTQRAQSFPGELHAARRDGHVVCVSQHDFDLAARWHIAPRARLHLIRNGIADTPHQNPTLRQSNQLANVASERQGLSLVMVARFAHPKRHDIVLRALAITPRARLTLIGDGPLQHEALNLISSLGLGDRVRILPHDTPVDQELISHDAFVLLSDYEGLPVSVLEGLRAGLPIIANDLDAMSEAVGSAGLLVTKSHRAVAKAINQLSVDQLLRIRLGTAARERFLELFTATTMFEQYEALYDDIVRLGS